MHWTHCLVSGLHTGRSPGHWALVVQVATQVRVTGSQTGLSPGQLAPERQPTQVFVAASHSGVAPVQACRFCGVQTTQKPSGCLQTGAPDVQFASVVQPRVQVLLFVLQTPLTPVQLLLLVHWTQTFAVVSQTGVAPVHAAAFVAEHSTHAPEPRHAGAVTVGQAAPVDCPWSPLHATQVPTLLQMGVLFEHWAFVLHWTHVFVVVLQADVAPWH